MLSDGDCGGKANVFIYPALLRYDWQPSKTLHTIGLPGLGGRARALRGKGGTSQAARPERAAVTDEIEGKT